MTKPSCAKSVSAPDVVEPPPKADKITARVSIEKRAILDRIREIERELLPQPDLVSRPRDSSPTQSRKEIHRAHKHKARDMLSRARNFRAQEAESERIDHAFYSATAERNGVPLSFIKVNGIEKKATYFGDSPIPPSDSYWNDLVYVGPCTKILRTNIIAQPFERSGGHTMLVNMGAQDHWL
jgi:hypothetical protein